ncbi:MAG: PAS domain-containing protein, partial [Clostridiales bacterium]|nr:PAS domain-containing protein [Clostridiales bacterium]
MRRLFLIYSCGLTGASIFLFLLAARLSYNPEASAVIVMTAAFLVSIPVIKNAIARAFEPINRMDLSSPEKSEVCEELAPLITRLRRRNDAIKNQLSEMRKTQIEFAAITDHMREGLLVLDKEARVLSYNQSALTLLHVRRENAAAHPNILTFRRDEPFCDSVERALQGVPAEILLFSEEKRLQMVVNPVTDNGKTRGAVLFLSDVTDREEQDKLRREFSANVSHELKTPIMVISGYAEIMAQGVAKPQDMSAFAMKIYNETQRLILLVDDIMMLSNLDEKKQIPKEMVEINGLIQEILERTEPNATAQAVSVNFKKGRKKITVAGSRRILEDMMYNLLDNAVKYNHAGGEVNIETGVSDDGVSVSFSDTGAGIPIGEQDRVFERFYRV